MSLPRLIPKVRSFLRWTWFEKALLPAAWLLLGASRLVILTVPFRYLAPRLGDQFGVSPWVPLLGSRSEARAKSIGRAVRSAADLTPWESNCFPQAVTARILLGLCGVPYGFFLGVARDSESSSGINGHAWVAAGRVPVSGGASFDHFTVIGSFVAGGFGARSGTLKKNSN
jgi:hypothetical protein